MRFSNLHQHSTFSDGKNTPREIVLAAIDKGFESIGFSDHSFTEIDQSYCMRLENYENYYNEINSLKKEFADKINVFLGIELDYYSEIDHSKFDYVIGSVHYIYVNGKCHPIDHSLIQQKTYVEEECGGDLNVFAQNYYDTVIKNIEKNKPDIVGHFDVISKFGLIDENNEKYREIASSALERVLVTTKIVEMNTGAISRKVKDTPYPHRFLLKRILELGGDIILGADSHAKETIDCYFPQCIQILKDIGFERIAKLTPNGFTFEKI